ncbi:hypothetical protein M407DRAFT_224264 [Tulasnella calospora MUT 4182]|uniref:Uncharacterized protein n=1 Tax=Tulasnella calospora MUT 4182 TaxID=1051891 RepID=A0A0C3KC14_9AGAM|nr:hypothetical protein M407DRAFT_224264 [Tulasnella calospora MUT 4182]
MARGASGKKRDIDQVDEPEETQNLNTEAPSKPARNKKVDDALQQTAADTNVTSGTRSTIDSDNATSPQSTLNNEKTDSGDATPAIKPAPTTPAKDLSAPPVTPARSTTRSFMAKTPASVDGIGRLMGSDDGDEAGEYSGDEAQKTTPKTPRSSNTLAAIAPLDPTLAVAWDMSERKKALFDEIYNATQGLKRKNDEGAKLGECLEIGDLVAVELYVKRYSRQNEKARHASFELVAIQLLRRGSPNEVNEVQASVSPKKTDAFSDEFFSEL